MDEYTDLKRALEHAKRDALAGLSPEEQEILSATLNLEAKTPPADADTVPGRIKDLTERVIG